MGRPRAGKWNWLRSDQHQATVILAVSTTRRFRLAGRQRAPIAAGHRARNRHCAQIRRCARYGRRPAAPTARQDASERPAQWSVHSATVFAARATPTPAIHPDVAATERCRRRWGHVAHPEARKDNTDASSGRAGSGALCGGTRNAGAQRRYVAAYRCSVERGRSLYGSRTRSRGRKWEHRWSRCGRPFVERMRVLWKSVSDATRLLSTFSNSAVRFLRQVPRAIEYLENTGVESRK